MLQFYIPEVVSVEQIFDEADDMQVKHDETRENIVDDRSSRLQSWKN